MRTILSFSFLLFNLCVLAQPTLTSSMSAAVGDTYPGVIIVDTTGVMPGNAGANQTWNFQNLITTNTTPSSTTVLPSATPYASLFPSATIAGSVGGTYGYVKVSSNKIEDVGTVNASQTITFSDFRTSLQFPFTYNSTYTDTEAAVIQQGGSTLNRTGTITATADAWGTLILPNGTYNNTLRIKYEENLVDASSGFNIISDATTYIWYSPNFKQALFTIYKQKFTILTSVQYTKIVNYASAPLAVGVDNAYLSQSLSVYPNPAQNEVNLTFDANQTYNDVSISLQTLEGKEVRKEEINEVLQGKFETSFSLEGLSRGVYIIKISTEGTSPICKKLYID